MSSGVGLPTRLLAPAAISASLLYEKVCTLLECLFDTCRARCWFRIFSYKTSIPSGQEPAVKIVQIDKT